MKRKLLVPLFAAALVLLGWYQLERANRESGGGEDGVDLPEGLQAP